MAMRVPSSCGYFAVKASSGRITTLLSKGLRIAGLDTRLLKLGRPDSVVQKCCCNQVLQIVIGLFLCLRPIFEPERRRRNVEARLEVSQRTDSISSLQAMVPASAWQQPPEPADRE